MPQSTNLRSVCHLGAVISVDQKLFPKLDKYGTEFGFGMGLRGFTKFLEKAFVNIDELLWGRES